MRPHHFLGRATCPNACNIANGWYIHVYVHTSVFFVACVPCDGKRRESRRSRKNSILFHVKNKKERGTPLEITLEGILRFVVRDRTHMWVDGITLCDVTCSLMSLTRQSLLTSSQNPKRDTILLSQTGICGMYVELRRMVGNRRTVSTGIWTKQEAVRQVYKSRRLSLKIIIHFDNTLSTLIMSNRSNLS